MLFLQIETSLLMELLKVNMLDTKTQLWTAARNAAKAVIDLNQNQLADFGAPDKNAVVIAGF